ncbi:hypothetical protein K4K57_010517 [Colletotrichum sp. SAR 10_99]|nr:hypothetical protein K4K55_010063 [Colletotrichum sp. SAR 10_96]KAI8249753.1 hypothetical protein K4K56_010126 [Colletotrichum sp. SAR 10_98]KAJ5008018.1 hypothetical protein K4K57_010517 [Colletotrichum sp. SAR 10_99]
MDGQQQQRDERAGQNNRVPVNGAQSAAGPRRRNDESWVEIASQPSSSSLSSIGDEIVTTGLRVGGSMAARRRRLHHPPAPRSFHVDQTAIHAGTSSQEEYEESESEEDRCLTSSTENVQPSVRAPFQQELSVQVESEDSDDGDEIATALGARVPDDPVFRPHPNAFSHPPSGLHRSQSAGSAIHQHPHSGVRPSLSHRSQTRVHRSPPNFMSPAYQADNDAALRASLTTLLSCAAAARGLPKYKDSEQQGAPAATGVGPSSQPVELRLMPESELMTDRQPQPQGPSPAKTPARSRTATSSTPSSPKSKGVDKHKRTSSSQTRSSRATKKKVAAGEDALISPTLLTWVVSAGVVVLVSVVGFGAGYVIGREVGRQEVLSAAGAGVNASTVADSSSCGREVIRSSGGGLRRLRWGAGVGRSVVA